MPTMLDWLKRALLYAVLFLAAAAAITFVADYAVLRYRIAAQKNAFGQIVVTPYYAIHLKNGNTEYDFQPPQPQSCANSLYPHLGLQPCWYLSRHREKRIEI